MAEQVSSLLRRSVEHLADEVPDSYRLVLEELGPLVVELDVDGELFSLRGGRRLEVSDGAADTRRCPDRHLASRHPRRARCQGRAQARPWRRARCAVRGSLDDIQRAHDTLLAYVHAAVRAPSQPGLLAALRTAPLMTEAIATPASCKRRRTVAVLGAGIAGLTAAHELAERGFDVTVYEPRRMSAVEAGSRSRRAPTHPSSSAASPPPSTRRSAPTPEAIAELRPFPGRRGHPRPPARAVAGEHGFRFFPAYYLHTWDLFQRIPDLPAHGVVERRSPLATDLTHRHGQRQAGSHPGHHG